MPMGLRAVCLFALVAVVGACETNSEDDASSSMGGTGGSGAMEASASGPGSGSGAGLGSGSIAREGLPPAQALIDVGDRVFFGYDQYDLGAEARATLDQQAALLRTYPVARVVIQGHADERGTREYNLALGDRRANAVKDYLVALGIGPDRIRTVSYGEERPAVIGSTESAFAQNRRAVTVVSDGALGS